MLKKNQSIATFLTFCGNAREAINYYVSLFPNEAQIESIREFKDGEQGVPGKILNAAFNIRGQHFMAMDMDNKYCTPFSWATSIFVECADEAEFDRLYQALSYKGSTMMGPEPVMELRKVCWVTDSFGVTWQLVWA